MGRSRCLRIRFWPAAYLSRLRKPAFDGIKVPDRPEWFHGIKQDGYRLVVQREGKAVRLWPRNGYYWSSRYPRMVEPRCATGPTPSSWMAKPCCSASTASPTFNALHSCKHDDEVQLYTFDVMMSAGDDLRRLPLHLRKHYLAKTLRRRVDGIILNEFEQGEIGPELFRHACLMRLEGIVSKHKDQPYRAGRSKHWIKVKNRTSPAMNRPEGML